MNNDPRESFLLIGPWDPQLRDIGARMENSLADILPSMPPCDVLGVTVTTMLEKKFAPFREGLLAANPAMQIVAVVPAEYATTDLISLHQAHAPFRVLTTTAAREAEPALYQALEKASGLRQENAIVDLLRDREQRLEKLRAELESRVEKRTRLLAESRHNLNVRNSRLEGLRRALLAVQAAPSLEAMEQALSQALAGAVELSWVRIVPIPLHETFAKEVREIEEFAWLSVPLWRGSETIGAAFFMRPKDRPFRREDTDFLGKVSEAVSLALDRLQKRAEAESLRDQWEATFSAIEEPVAVIDRAYNVIQLNAPRPAGGTCHERIFGRATPCTGCRRGETFRVTNDGRVWEVHSQLLALEPSREPLFVNLYSDVTERLHMEQRIVESAKMAELGTIGSSIAHELNNPLGGVLNFAQLLRMDLPKDHPISEDVARIEEGARRCKEIVENLLGFTRAPRSDEIREFDVREAARRALAVIELRTKSIGVETIFNAGEAPFQTRGHFNLVVQAIAGVLERALDSILARRVREPSYRGRIELTLAASNDHSVLEIRDDGDGSESAARQGLSLQISSQILRDNGAQLEIKGPSSPVSSAKISFARPVLRS